MPNQLRRIVASDNIPVSKLIFEKRCDEFD